jgi:2'-5' RNA ligase
MHRLFVAIRPPARIRDLLIDAMDDTADLRWQSDEQLHLTLRFIGSVDRPRAEDLAGALQRVRSPAFTLAIAGLGSFDHRSGGAIYAGVSPREPVAALAAKVERACQSAGLPPEQRAFLPHVALARWSGRRSREVGAWLTGRQLWSASFAVDRFLLFESHLSRHGAHYEAVGDFPLDG